MVSVSSEVMEMTLPPPSTPRALMRPLARPTAMTSWVTPTRLPRFATRLSTSTLSLNVSGGGDVGQHLAHRRLEVDDHVEFAVGRATLVGPALQPHEVHARVRQRPLVGRALQHLAIERGRVGRLLLHPDAAAVVQQDRRHD